MVYIDSTRILQILEKTNLFIKYPSVKNEIKFLAPYLYKTFGYSSTYQRIGRRLISNCRRYCISSKKYVTGGETKRSFTDYLRETCVRDLYMFYCFYQNQLEDFKSCQYLSDFFGKPVENILELFEVVNLYRDVPVYCKNKKDIELPLKKIFKTYLLLQLAKTFYQIDIAIKSNSLTILCEMGLYYIRMIPAWFQTKMYDAIKSGKNIDLESMNIHADKLYDSFSNESMDKMLLLNFLMEIYQQNKKLYYFFESKSVDEIRNLFKKNIDLEAMVGKYYINRKMVSKSIILRYIANHNFWLINKLVGDNSNSEHYPVKNLQVQCKIPNKKIVIEI